MTKVSIPNSVTSIGDNAFARVIISPKRNNLTAEDFSPISSYFSNISGKGGDTHRRASHQHRFPLAGDDAKKLNRGI